MCFLMYCTAMIPPGFTVYPPARTLRLRSIPDCGCFSLFVTVYSILTKKLTNIYTCKFPFP